MTNPFAKIFEGLIWRYKLRVQPYLVLDGDPLSAVKRRCNNFAQRRTASPVCYIFADAGNIGDCVSALGVRLLAGQPGLDLFASRAGLPCTFATLRWLQEHRPQTKIIIGGGGLLQECFVPFWQGLLQTRLPFALFGVGANELSGSRDLPPKALLREVAFRARYMHVRDQWTRELMSLGQSGAISVGVCPSVNYLRSLADVDADAEKKYLFHVQHPVDVRMAGGNPEQIAKTVRALAVSHDLKYDETVHIKEDLHRLMARYQRARYVVSSRLHGCIFSYALGVPFVPILSDSKTAAFIKSHCPENPIVDVNITMNGLAEKLEIAEQQIPSREGRVGELVQNNVTAMHRALGLLTD